MGDALNEVLADVREFTARHPDVTITPPDETKTKLFWEVRAGYGVSQWDDPNLMLATLNTWHAA